MNERFVPHQARPRGAARPRLDLHGGLPGDDGRRRLAAERLPHPGAGPLLRRHLLPARAAHGNAELARRCSRPSPRPGTSAATRSAPAATAIAERLRGGALLRAVGASRSTRARSTQAVEGLRAQYDPAHGGFGSAPKFPPASALEFLLRRGETEMAAHTLRAMASGGMYDQVGGGFARYSVDPYWLVPHFEKMLYDNALLARAYLHGWQVTRRRRCSAEVAEETLDWALQRDARRPRAASSPRSTPTPRASRASSTSGPSTSCARRWPASPTPTRRSPGSAPPTAATSRARNIPVRGPGRPERLRRLAPAPLRRARASACGPASTTSA